MQYKYRIHLLINVFKSVRIRTVRFDKCPVLFGENKGNRRFVVAY